MNKKLFISELLSKNKSLIKHLTYMLKCSIINISIKRRGSIVRDHLKDLYNYLAENKCKDIAVYNLSDEGQSYDYIYIATISNNAANKKLALLLMEEFDIEEYPEGYHKGEWIIFDFGQCLLHLFIGQVREKYNLDKLWKSKKITI